MSVLWIVEQQFACSPKVSTWELLRDTDDSYVVRLRDGTKTFRKKVAGRRYFFALQDAAFYLRGVYAVQLEQAKRAVQRMSYLVAGSDQLVIDYGRGLDAAYDEVENSVVRPLSTNP